MPVRTISAVRAELTEAQAKRDRIAAEMSDLHHRAEGRSLSDGEQQRWDRLDAGAQKARLDVESLDSELRGLIGDLARSPGHTENGDGTTGAPRSPEFMRRVEPFDGSDVRSLQPMEARDKALKAAEMPDLTRHLSDDQQAKVHGILRTQNGDLDGSHVSRLLLMTENVHYRTGWQKLITQPTPVLTSEEARAISHAQEFRAMSGSVDTSGGFGVPVLIDPAVILTAQGSLNPFRKISRVETVTTDAWRGVSSAGVSWSYDTEGSAVSDDTPTLGQPTVAIHEARGWIPFSIRVGQDYPGFAQEMSRLLMEGYDELQAQKFAVGSGSDEPFGIITALDANTNVEVVVTTDGAFGGADINKVWSALPDRSKANATWVMGHDVASEVAILANANNWSYFTVDLTGVVEKIRNRPVEFSSYFPDFTGTTGASNILVVGDFRNYLIADRVGMTVEVVPHLFDPETGRPTGQRGLFAFARNGADSINDAGLRLLQNQ